MRKGLDEQNSVFCVPTDFVEHQTQDPSVEGSILTTGHLLIPLIKTVLSVAGVLYRRLMPF